MFRYPTPQGLWEKTVIDSRIRQDIGCIIVALIHNGAMKVNPGPEDLLVEGSEMILMGSTEAERKFIETYGKEA